MKNFMIILALLGLSACTQGVFGLGGAQNATADAAPSVAVPEQPQVDPDAPPPPPTSARTVEQFDTTSAEDRAQAVSSSNSGTRLGTTIANLGDPTDPGIWLRTPLVTEVRPGRVEYEGKSVNLELRPSGGEPGSGSRISLAAIRLVGAPLTSLPELTVYAN